jgi:ribonuclease P protein component
MERPRDESFPKRERIRSRADFLRAQRRGQKFQTARFLIFVQRTQAPTARVGITVSKKVGGAVERNRVKRLLREVYRRHKDLFPAGLDVVFVAKREATEARVDTILEEVRLFARWAASQSAPAGQRAPRPAQRK